MLLVLADYTTPLLDKKFGTKSTLNEKLKEAAYPFRMSAAPLSVHYSLWWRAPSQVTQELMRPDRRSVTSLPTLIGPG